MSRFSEKKSNPDIFHDNQPIISNNGEKISQKYHAFITVRRAHRRLFGKLRTVFGKLGADCTKDQAFIYFTQRAQRKKGKERKAYSLHENIPVPCGTRPLYPSLELRLLKKSYGDRRKTIFVIYIDNQYFMFKNREKISRKYPTSISVGYFGFC